MRTVALIPVKFINRRLPGKNTKLLGGKPLMAYIQETLLQVKGLDEIYIYCSDERVKEYILGGVRFLKRSPALDRDTTKINEVLVSFANEVDADYYLLAHATAPFLRAESVQRGLDGVKSGQYDSAFSAEKLQEFLWQNGRPLNYDLAAIPRTQDLVPVYSETCGFYLYSRELILQRNRRIGERPMFVEVDKFEAVDIDGADDFLMAEAVLRAKG